MSKLWKKATFPTIEDLAKEVGIKQRLTHELKSAIKTFIGEKVGKDDVVQDGDSITDICTALEAVFIHGLKGKFSARMASVFSGTSDVRIPEPDFWAFIMIYSHKDVLSRINAMKQISTDVGRCRAWLRMAINDGLLCSYLDTMISDKTTLQSFYSPVAYLRDDEEPEIMKQVLTSITVFSFQLPCNTLTLNIWSSTPLVLAGLWTPPPMPQPVMPAVDVMEFFADQDKQSHGKTAERQISIESVIKNEGEQSCTGYKIADLNSNCNSQVIETTINDENTVTQTSSIDETNLPCEIKECDNAESVDILPNDNVPQCSVPLTKNENESMPIAISTKPISGNRLWIESGWSSEFEYVPDEIKLKDEKLDQESYDSLLQNYNKNRPMTGVLIGTPDLSEMMSKNLPETEDKANAECVSVESQSTISDYEVIPKTFLFSGESDERTKHLLSVIGTICPEKGLDSQSFQCRGCGCPIGMLYGKAYLCSYDGYSYCSTCHCNDEYYIPARIVHNWDFKKYPVAKYTKTFLTEIENEPLLNLKLINPLIYSAVPEMDQLQSLRTQLMFLRSYIFTCKESVIEELRKKVWPKEYLYEHVHLFSVSDFLQCSTKALHQTLQKIISFAKKHVLNCQLCSMKAFICEICNNPNVLYPFDMDVAYHCDKCLAVYHRTCIETKKFCPKCERKRKRLEISSCSIDSF